MTRNDSDDRENLMNQDVEPQEDVEIGGAFNVESNVDNQFRIPSKLPAASDGTIRYCIIFMNIYIYEYILCIIIIPSFSTKS